MKHQSWIQLRACPMGYALVMCVCMAMLPLAAAPTPAPLQAPTLAYTISVTVRMDGLVDDFKTSQQTPFERAVRTAVQGQADVIRVTSVVQFSTSRRLLAAQLDVGFACYALAPDRASAVVSLLSLTNLNKCLSEEGLPPVLLFVSPPKVIAPSSSSSPSGQESKTTVIIVATVFSVFGCVAVLFVGMWFDLRRRKAKAQKWIATHQPDQNIVKEEGPDHVQERGCVGRTDQGITISSHPPMSETPHAVATSQQQEEERARRDQDDKDQMEAETKQTVENARGAHVGGGRRIEEDGAGVQARGGAGAEMIDFGELELEGQLISHELVKEVYRATWRQPGQQGEGVCVAVLVRKQDGSLEAEVEVMKKLGRGHPHLCRLLGTTVKPPSGNHTSGSQGMVMEYAEMGSLDVVLRNITESGADRPTDGVLLTAVGQVCEGMEMLSEHNIIHGDVAARNCVVFGFHSTIRRHVCIKVADYWRTVDAARGKVITKNSGSAAGLVRWMAPEAILSSEQSPESDVYAFGVLMWEVFTLGNIPFWSMPDDETVADKVVKDGARPERPDECPDAVYAVMQSCWRQVKEERPTFSQLRIDLREALLALDGKPPSGS